MPKRIIHSKKHFIKKGKRTQRKFLKHRNLKTIKGGMFKRAKNIFSKKKAQGFKRGINRKLIGEAFNKRQSNINSTKLDKNRIKGYLTGIDISKLKNTFLEISELYKEGESVGINSRINEGIKAIEELQNKFKKEIDSHNKTLGDLKGDSLIKEVNDGAKTLDASLGPLVSQQKSFSSNFGKALENASNQIRSGFGDPWFLSKALKTASLEYLLNEDNKFSIQKLFDNYLMKNKNLNNLLNYNGENILEGYQISLINQLRNPTIPPQAFGSTGPLPKLNFLNNQALSQQQDPKQELSLTESNITAQVTKPESFDDVAQTSYSLNNPEGLPEVAEKMIKYQAQRKAEAEANPFQPFKGTPPTLPEGEGSGEEVTPALPQEIAPEGPTSPPPIKRDGSGGNGQVDPFNVGNVGSDF